MKISYGNPSFTIRQSKGKYPYGLSIGFENEVELIDDNQSIHEAIQDFVSKDNFLYVKEDGSLHNGIEINSQPFNYNWFLENRELLNFTSYLNENGLVGDDTCGFHIHFNRSYFSTKHLRRLLNLVYNNPDFWSKVSQREGEANLEDFASLDRLRDDYCSGKMTWRDANAIIERGRTEHYDALDIGGSAHTIEFRIFRGTNNPNLIQTYLEVGLAMILYTEHEEFKNVSVENFIKYVYKNKRLFKAVVRSNILRGKCKYRWDSYQPLTKA